ncbi:MAG: DUF6565 domain-containing protein [Bacteroidia bacterium]
MKTQFIITFFAAIVLFSGCTYNKTTYLKDYDSFMEEVKEDHKSFSARDWEKKNEQFRVMVEEEYPEFEPEMTQEEKVKFWTQAFVFQFYQHKDKVFDELENNKEVYSEMMEKNAEFINTLSEDFSKDILPEIEKTLPEFKKLGKDLMDRLEDKGTLDKMKDNFEELGKQMKEINEKLEEN